MYEDDDDTESDENEGDRTCKINEVEHEEQTVCPKKVCIEPPETQRDDGQRRPDEVNWSEQNETAENEECEEENYESTSDSEYEYHKPDIEEYQRRHANQFEDDPCFNRPGEEFQTVTQLQPLKLDHINIETSGYSNNDASSHM